MDERGGPALFLGELDDPWVAAIADALPPSTLRMASYGELPEEWPSLVKSVGTLILHRSVLTPTDAERLRRLRNHADVRGPRVVLCVGPYARYHQLTRWSSLADAIVSESIAAEVIGRYAGEVPLPSSASGRRGRIVVLSTNHEMRQLLSDVCVDRGYTATAVRDWSEVRPGATVIWDVPVLEQTWPETLARESRTRRVLCLLGLAERATVVQARAHGAAACLELPFEAADIAYVLDRIALTYGALADPAHTLPPAPARLRLVRPEPDHVESRPVVDPRR